MRIFAKGLAAVAFAVAAMIIPMMWPNISSALGIPILVACAGLAVAAALLFVASFLGDGGEMPSIGETALQEAMEYAITGSWRSHREWPFADVMRETQRFRRLARAGVLNVWAEMNGLRQHIPAEYWLNAQIDVLALMRESTHRQTESANAFAQVPELSGIELDRREIRRVWPGAAFRRLWFWLLRPAVWGVAAWAERTWRNVRGSPPEQRY